MTQRRACRVLTRPTHADMQAQLDAVRAAHPAQSSALGGHTWSWVEAGCGESVVLLLPGALGEADTSFQYILALCDTWRVISVGYPPTLDRLWALLDGLDALLERLDVDRAHVVGGSYSGLVAQYFAAHRPQRVRSLLLSNTGAPVVASARPWLLAAELWSRLPETLLQRVMQASIRRFLPGDSPAELFWRDYFAVRLPHWSKSAIATRLWLMGQMQSKANARQLLHTPFDGPVLIIDADGDRLVSPRARRALWAIYPQAQRAAMTDKGHVASLDEAANYIQLYQEFLCRVSVRPSSPDAA